MTDEALKQENQLQPRQFEVLGMFLTIEEAAAWVAFESFQKKTFDPPYHLEHLISNDETTLLTDWERNDAQYRMAFGLIVKAAMRGQVEVYGRLYEPEQGEEPDPVPEDVLKDGRTRKILPEEFRDIWTYLDDALLFGGRIYDLVVINWHDLIKVFGPLTLDYGSHFLKEDQPPSKAVNSIADQPLHLPRRGRPQKWDWERIFMEITLLANTPDGLPDTQAELETWVANKCIKLFGDEPGISTIRSKIAPLYSRLRQKSQ